jgi:hypothetical protein
VDPEEMDPDTQHADDCKLYCIIGRLDFDENIFVEEEYL